MYKEIESNSLYIADLKRVFELNIDIKKVINSTFLITGASGLIGSCLVDLLMIIGSNVIAVGRNAEKGKKRFKNYLGRNNFKFIECDVTKEIDIEDKVDYIVHAASNASPRSFYEDPVGTMNANYIGTYNLLEFSKKNKIKRFLYVSSGEIYGESSLAQFSEYDDGHIDLLNVRACYPISKRAGETLCVAYSKQFHVDTVIVRPCHIYGPTFTEKDNRILAEFIKLGLEKKDIILKSSGRQTRSNCYVVDAAIGLLYVLLLGDSGEAYNISNSDGKASIREVAQIIAEYSDVEIIIDNDEDIGRMNAVLGDSKLRGLGWKPIYGIKDGIHRTLDILRMCSFK